MQVQLIIAKFILFLPQIEFLQVTRLLLKVSEDADHIMLCVGCSSEDAFINTQAICIYLQKEVYYTCLLPNYSEKQVLMSKVLTVAYNINVLLCTSGLQH